MAKTTPTPQTQNTPVAELTTKTRKAVEAIRRPFGVFIKDFSSLSEKREDLAPKFMKAFNLWATETGGTFVEFVRFLDPSLPQSSKEYRAHRSYGAADYLRRLVAQARRGERSTERTAQERATAPATPMVGMARVLSALMQLIPEDQHIKITEAISEELHWNDRQILRLEQLMQEHIPLVAPKGKVEFPKKLTLIVPHEATEDVAVPNAA